MVVFPQAKEYNIGMLTPNTEPIPIEPDNILANRERAERIDSEPFWAAMPKYIGAMVPRTIDNIAELLPGIEKGDVESVIYSQLPDAAEWVRRNDAGVEVAGGLFGAVAGGIAAEMAVARLVKSSWFAATGVGKAITPLVAKVDEARAAAQIATQQAAAAGKSLGLYEGANGVFAAYMVGQGIARAAVGEAGAVALMQKNSVIWDDDMSVNALYGVLGLGIGGVLGGVAGRADILRYAASEDILNLNANAIDPAGYQRASLLALRENQAMGPVLPKQSSIITSIAIDANRVIPNDAASAEVQRAMSTQLLQEVQKQTQVLTAKGTYGIPNSGFNVKGNATGEALLEQLYDDPTLLLGAASISKIPNGYTLRQAIDERRMAVNAIKNHAVRRAEGKQIPLVLVNGEWQAASTAVDIGAYNPNATRFVKDKFGGYTWRSQHTGKPIGMREDGRLNRNWESLTVTEQLEARDAMRALIKDYISVGKEYNLPKDYNYIELDLADEIVANGGSVNLALSGFSDINDLRIASMRLKYERIKELGTELDAKTRFTLNLPTRSNNEYLFGENSVELRQTLRAALDDTVTYDELLNTYKDATKKYNPFATPDDNTKLTGDLFNYNLNRKGEWLQPLLGYFDPAAPAMLNKDSLRMAIIAHKADQINTLAQEGLLANLTKNTLNHPATMEVLNTAKLANNQVAYLQNNRSMLLGQFLTTEFKNRYSALIKNAMDVRQLINKVTENHINRVMRGLLPNLEALSSITGASKKSRALYDSYYSFAGGWDIERAIELDNGLIGFVLENTPNNRKRLGRAVKPDDLLTSPKTNKPVVLDAAANTLRMELEDIYADILQQRNLLRKARGLAPIKRRNFYVPPPRTKGKLIGYTLDENNNLVAGKTVIADNAHEFKAMKAALNLAPNERFLAAEEIRAFTDLWQQLELDFIDPTTLAAKPAGSKGILRGQELNAQALDDTIEYIKNAYTQVSDGFVRTMFEAQLKHTRMREAAEGNIMAGYANKAGNIYDEYRKALLGVPDYVNERGVNVPLKAAENISDALLEEMHYQLKIPKQWIADAYGKLGRPIIPKKLNVSFESLANDLKDYTPFATVDEYIAYKQAKNPPWRTAGIARNMRSFAAFVLLRALEIPHAMMNMSGLIVNIPAIVGRRGVPTMGSVKGAKDGEKIPVMDTAAIIDRGIKRLWESNKRGTRDWEYMVRMGFVTQKVADLQTAMNTIKNASTLEKVMIGDARFQNWRRIKNPVKRHKAMVRAKGVSGMLSIISDTSEDWSRQLAHFVGLELADYQGITKFADRHAFANDFANQTIANYNPLNRPEMYQSAVGSLYGLFLSYVQQYYQRLFLWVEQRDTGALAKNLGLQASLFGAMSLPLMNQFAALLGGEKELDSVLDNIYDKFGPEVGSVIANGGFNQITTLFGLPAMGINARGDINIRTPATDSIAQGNIVMPVSVQLLSDTISGVYEIASKYVDPNVPLSGQNVAEILARQLPSRALKGVITVAYAGGKESDVYGNLMAETRGWMENAKRSLGVRSLRQQRELEAYYANRTMLAKEAEQMARVRQATRAAIRAEQYDRLVEIFEDYLSAGGRPENYKLWVEGIIEEATNTRLKNQLQQSLRSPAQQRLAQRIQLYGAL